MNENMEIFYYVCMVGRREHRTFSQAFTSFDNAELYRSTLSAKDYSQTFVVQTCNELHD